ncbi:hypothetical protein PAAL66ix_08741 [Paenibacillus alvei A6-6i-x]|nr:CapA family protein [Paenibacillus sp. UNC217MF]EPY13123.1 hypothetical protein PAAL66ix_08741 [Paenibacillus alvei A6-6i-x]
MIFLSNSITFTATGDSLIARRLPSGDVSMDNIKSIIQLGDVRFTNLETTVQSTESFPSAVSGGTWSSASPEMFCDLLGYGFNLVAWANNHTLDFSYGGLRSTEQLLNKYGIVHAGAGNNLASASEPRYLETNNNRVALIATTSNFDRTWIAGEQRRDMIGRPGINPMRLNTIYTINATHMKQLKEIAENCKINSAYQILTNKGYMKEHPDCWFPFGEYIFQEGDSESTIIKIDPRDENRIVNSIREAKRQSDYVVLSIHTHQPNSDDLEEPADFIVNFARKCIDEGAHAIICHGPHIVRGIEIYKNRPIFYSLGNFIFQNESITSQPSDFYDKFGLGHEHNIADVFDKKEEIGLNGLSRDYKVWQSLIPYWKMENGELRELALYPIDLGFEKPRYKRGWPELTSNMEVLHNVAQLSRKFGVEIEIMDGVGKIHW